MKLIIDIPEDEVNECKMQVDMIKQEGFLIESLNTALKIHVANGTPLPKGHGNLIQREEAEIIFRNARMALYKQSRTERIKDFQTRESMLLNAEQFVHLIKPIIEADKEQEDNGFFDEIMDDESDGEVYEKIKEIIDKVKEQEE